MLSNATPLEVGWTVVAVFGMVPAMALVARSVRLELKRHRSGVNGSLERDLHKDVAVGLALFAVTGCFALSGVIAMAAPAATAVVDPALAVARVVTPLLFILANVVVTAVAGYCLIQQTALDRDIEAAADRHRRSSDWHAP